MRVLPLLSLTSTAYEALRELLHLPDCPSAVFVTNNQMTLGTLYAMREQGLRCPEDVSLVGFDDQVWAPLFTPPFTAVRRPTYRLGQTRVQLLMRLTNGQKVEAPQPLPVQLIIREPCRRLTERVKHTLEGDKR